METLKLMFPALALRQSKSRNRRLCVINAQKNIYICFWWKHGQFKNTGTN